MNYSHKTNYTNKAIEKLNSSMKDSYADKSIISVKLDDDKGKDYVTLAYEDYQQEWAHKVIMAPSSSFFQNTHEKQASTYTVLCE